eukprot:scaffold91439_cov39-Prasinocladus_malaysianus.AAC.2
MSILLPSDVLHSGKLWVAGPITPGYVPEQGPPKSGQIPFWVANSMSKLLISYLEGTIANTLVWSDGSPTEINQFYPSNNR